MHSCRMVVFRMWLSINDRSKLSVRKASLRTFLIPVVCIPALAFNPLNSFINRRQTGNKLESQMNCFASRAKKKGGGGSIPEILINRVNVFTYIWLTKYSCQKLQIQKTSLNELSRWQVPPLNASTLKTLLNKSLCCIANVWKKSKYFFRVCHALF